KGPRRRPGLADHCEADVLDVFDEWRRAVGITTGMSADPDASPRPRVRDSLATLLARALARLTALRAGGSPPMPPDLLAEAVSELDRLIPSARTSRGQARDELTRRLAELDRQLLEGARVAAGPAVLRGLRARAAEDPQ